MLSLLVCHSYFSRQDQKQWSRAKPYPPLATLHVAAMLRRAGHRVELFDSMLAEGVHEFAQSLASTAPQVVLIYEDVFNYLTKMCLDVTRVATLEMIGLARDAGCRILVAGPDASDAPTPYLAAGADVVLPGEGLAVLFEVLARLRQDIAQPAVTLRAGITPRVLSVNEAKGFAAWDLVDMPRYRARWREAHGYFSLNLAASRGCSFRCSWCAKPTWGNRYLQRDPNEVAADMAYLRRAFQPDHFWFADDIFGLRAEWVEDFARAVRDANARTPFTIQTRADLISERMANALRDAGCTEAWIGAESGSQKILDAMNKGTTVPEILRARERFRARGIRVGFFIQLGYLGEALTDILATRELVEAAAPDDIGVSVSYPLPGTRFYEQVRQQLGWKTHWRESDDLDMMFQGTYTTDFYRRVRNLLHDQVSDASQDDSARRLLGRRWSELIGEEARHRMVCA